MSHAAVLSQIPTVNVYRGPGSALGLFGWDLINADSTEVILVSTEFDAMIIHQALRKPVLCLPKGISVLPVEVCLLTVVALPKQSQAR